MNDEQVRGSFAELRRFEGQRAPRFDRMWARSASRRRLSWAFAFVTLLLIVLTASVLYRSHKTLQPAISAWRAPTDFLLQTPGRQLLSSIPDLKGNVQ